MGTLIITFIRYAYNRQIGKTNTWKVFRSKYTIGPFLERLKGERNSSIIDNETWICNKNRHLRYHKYKNRSVKGVVKTFLDMKIIQISQMSCFIFLFFYEYIFYMHTHWDITTPTYIQCKRHTKNVNFYKYTVSSILENELHYKGC